MVSQSAEQVIVSASRRTDISTFNVDGFMRRVRAGCCEVANPMNSRQVARVSRLPEEIDAIVFWTRCPMAEFADEAAWLMNRLKRIQPTNP